MPVRPLTLTSHAVDKLATYAMEAARLASCQEALHAGEAFLDVTSGAIGNVFWWVDRPWVVIFSQDGERVVKIYPTDERTVTNRRGGGRWISPNT